MYALLCVLSFVQLCALLSVCLCMLACHVNDFRGGNRECAHVPSRLRVFSLSSLRCCDSLLLMFYLCLRRPLFFFFYYAIAIVFALGCTVCG